MKKFVFLFLLFVVSANVSYSGEISSSCTYNGIPLYGRVQIVNSFEDFRVKRVDSFEDIRVKDVSSFATSCGRWQFVNAFPDFKIKYVDSFEDFRVKFVNAFEGI